MFLEVIAMDNVDETDTQNNKRADTFSVEIGNARSVVVGPEGIVNNITNIVNRALTAGEAAETSRAMAGQMLAQGVRDYAQRLAIIATQYTYSDKGSPY